jgi:hypothetical protein
MRRSLCRPRRSRDCMRTTSSWPPRLTAYSLGRCQRHRLCVLKRRKRGRAPPPHLSSHPAPDEFYNDPLSFRTARTAPASSKPPARSNDLSASRCEKTARNYGAFVALARASILIKSVHRASESPRIWVKIIQISVADEVLRRHSPFEGFHSSESVQHPDFYRYQESYPRRNGSPRNCCSRAGDERSAVPVSV